MASTTKGPIKTNTISIFLIIFIAFAVALSVYAINYRTQDCQKDQGCFRQNEIDCKRSTVQVIKDGNLFSYTIDKKRQNTCYVSVSVVEVNPNSGQELKGAFEGKSMYCQIPLDQIKKVSVISNNDIFDFCTGPLKEATYELIIKKLYSVIAQNLGPILSKADQAINQTKELK